MQVFVFWEGILTRLTIFGYFVYWEETLDLIYLYGQNTNEKGCNNMNYCYLCVALGWWAIILLTKNVAQGTEQFHMKWT